MRQDRKKFKDDDTQSVMSEAKSHRSMVIDGSSVGYDSYERYQLCHYTISLSDNVIEAEQITKNIRETQPDPILATEFRTVS